MTMRNKQELIQQMINLLNAMINVEKIEMLTIKKCTQQISVLSEHGKSYNLSSEEQAKVKSVNGQL